MPRNRNEVIQVVQGRQAHLPLGVKAVKGITAKDVEILGWALATVTPEAPPQLESLLDMMDRQFTAKMAGLEAGLNGHMQGENPFMCSACKNQWQAGWVEGNARREYIALRCGPITAVLL